MRKIGAAVLAVPILALVYLAALWHRPRALRATLATGLAIGVFIVAITLLPRPTTAVAPSSAGPLAAEQFGPDVEARDALSGAVEISFQAPMDPASVEAALRVSPATQVRLAWSDGGKHLQVAPATRWAPATYYTLAIAGAARTASGAQLSEPQIKGFYTRRPTVAQFGVEGLGPDGRLATTARFIVTFDRPVQADSAKAAFAVSPDMPGTLEASGDAAGTMRLTFVPAGTLASNTTYTVSFKEPVLDRDGTPVDAGPALTVRTAKATKVATQPVTRTPKAPAVVRFRPRANTTAIDVTSNISVRFTRAMNQRLTERAFLVTVKGKRVVGSFAWYENNTVLVLDPKDSLPPGASIAMRVTTAARGADGSKLAKALSATFTTAGKATSGKPTPKPTPKPRPTPKPKPPPSGGGGSGGGAWASVERYYLGLMNCTRQGGWVTGSGSCSSPGGSGIRALWIDRGISNSVSRPYAKLLATTGVCSHFYGGNPGNRLRRAGYTSYRWAENLGCRSAPNAYASVLGTHLYFQSERAWRPQGGHWVNLMNPAYDRVGLGVYVSHGRVRLVIDFYHP